MCLRLIYLVTILGVLLHFIGSIWFIYTLIIIFLGGIIIVFVYAAAINNIFKIFTLHYNAFTVRLFVMIRIFYLSQPEFYLNHGQFAIWNFPLSISYNFIIFLSLIILLSLFIIVKIVQIEQGPLKR